MLDLKYVTENLETVIDRLSTRNGDLSYLRKLPGLQQDRKEIIMAVESLKAKRNETSRLIGVYKKEGKDTKELFDTVAHNGDDIKNLDEKLACIEKEIFDILSTTPNLPNASVPIGKDDTQNVECYKVGMPKVFDFEVKDHVALGEKLGILDFERAAKITGTRFVVDKGLGARLERALIAFMLDLHSDSHGYTELIPPYIVNGASMFATGQFPKFKSIFIVMKSYQQKIYQLNIRHTQQPLEQKLVQRVVIPEVF